MAKRKPTTKSYSKELQPKRLPRRVPAPEREQDGPRGWFLEQMECSLIRLAETGSPSPPRVSSPARGAFRSRLLPEAGEEILHAADAAHWLDRLREYKERKSSVHHATRGIAPSAPTPGAPSIPGAINWVSLGPTVVHHGQTAGEESVGGRVSGLAATTNGTTIFAASACGGVFRSDDAGTSWRSLMDGFDVDPTTFAATSLACGAIAIDLNDPQRIYVGTGEGDTNAIFRSRIVNALPAYRGIGPIRSDDGGGKWVIEPVASGSGSLAGEAFFSLAVDPRDREHVIAATTAGLYQRSVSATGPSWRRRRDGIFSSVVVARSGATTRFFAAKWGTGIVRSTDGSTWTDTNTGFPTANVGRIALGIRPSDPEIVYALISNVAGGLLGVYRLDGVGGRWTLVASPPPVLPSSQGDYDLAIAVDPNNDKLIYLGGSFFNADPFPGSVWRCQVQAVTGGGFKFSQKRSIGTHAHADIHVLALTPGNSDELWCGCDGGVFLNRNPRGTGEFAGMNEGLSCLCSNFIAQHPTDPGILFTGLQDNGTAQTSGSPAWGHVGYGDGGYCVINWASPNQVLSFANGTVNRSTTGGTSHNDWFTVWNFAWATMTQPIVTTPYTPATPGDAKWVAVGAGSKVYISKDFATSWPMTFDLPDAGSAGQVYALAFASTKRLFVGTTRGRVYQADRSGSVWTVKRIDNAAGGSLPLNGLIADVAVDWSDPTRGAIYVAFGGTGDFRHVWRFNGSLWEARSGTTPQTRLLDVEHNALAIDDAHPGHVYVGADIGVWRSTDGGVIWNPLQNGLPDAPVFDLQIHPTQRLLRAATHGRGVYELRLQ